MASTTATSARTTVFTIPELVEEIVGSLPQQDILRVQRVNSSWRDIVAKSAPVQRKLFFKLKAKPRGIKMLQQPSLIMNIGNPHLGGSLKPQCVYNSVNRTFKIAVPNFGDSSFGVRAMPSGSWRNMFVSDQPYGVTFHVAGGSYAGTEYMLTGTLGEIHDQLLKVKPPCMFSDA